MPDRQLLEWEWEWECGNGKKGSFGREGSVQRLKRERGGPNCSTSQTSDRRTILAQLRHPKVRKHTPAPLEPPPASTNAVGRVTTSTKKDLGDALISLHLQFTRTNQKRPRTTLPTPPSFPPSPPPAPAPTLTHQRPAALPHPARPKSVRETRPARADVSSRGHSQHKTTAPPPHRLSRVLSFLDLSLSLSLHPQTTSRVSPSSPFDTPLPPLQAHTTAIMGYSDADKLAINTIRVLAVRITPHPSTIPRGFTPPPPFRWCCCSAPPSMEGGQKKRQWCSLHRTTAMRGVG